MVSCACCRYIAAARRTCGRIKASQAVSTSKPRTVMRWVNELRLVEVDYKPGSMYVVKGHEPNCDEPRSTNMLRTPGRPSTADATT
jgi:hypothetical protein